MSVARLADAHRAAAHWIPQLPVTTFRLATDHLERGRIVEHSSPFGTLWAGIGLGAFYLALMWVNILLGHMLTPLFLIPLTWIQDAVQGKQT